MTLQIKTASQYDEVYQESIQNPTGFWGKQADTFEWFNTYDQVLASDFANGHCQWFVNGKLNITVNCLDRHIAKKGNQTAIIWEPNNPEDASISYTYSALLAAVCQCANALKAQGIRKGDTVVFYMPMIPQLLIGILACARIGAVHSVVFAGFSANALADRINDAAAKMVICADVNYRGDKTIPVKEVVDKALAIGCPSIEKVLVYQHSPDYTLKTSDMIVNWADIVPQQDTACPPEIMDAEDRLFILYTSGSTGKPKGIVHTCGGYMVYAAFSFRNVFQYQDGDTYWCTADIGWITGHTYITYGPLLSGATSVLFEGVPTFPNPGRFWAICEKYKVNQFYTAPTAIRALLACGPEIPNQYNLSALKVLGTVGEPINEEAWEWYHQCIGKSKLPIVDTWWQTETGGILISSLAGVTDSKPTFAAYPLPGILPVLVDVDGIEITEPEKEGLLCIKQPWPSMLRTIHGSHERCFQTYYSAVKGMYFTGDGAKRDKEGRFKVIGRVDDVINVSGHRFGTAELENAINEHDMVVESAVVGFPHEIKGQGIFAFVRLAEHCHQANMENEIKKTVQQLIGAIAKPDLILFVPDLPKTRSGKIMRRILRKLAAQEFDSIGDVSTLLNPEVVEEIKQLIS